MMAPRSRSARVVFGFDMETDIGSWTPFYKGVVEGTPRLLALLAGKGIPATFFFTGDAAQQHPEVVRTVRDAGHEVGNHSLHHETMGDEIIPIPGIKPLLPEEIPGRLRAAEALITRALGRKPVSFRAPRLWGSTALVRTLEDLGYVADASYPMFFYGKQLAPYHPSARDWRRSGRMKILEIPNVADMGMRSRDAHGRDRDLWPQFRTRGHEFVMRRLESFARVVARERLPLVLCFYFHPWEFAAMPQGLIRYGEGAILPAKFIVKHCGAVALRELARLIDGLRERFDARFMTAQQLAADWR
ncbi:MAG TPA: polysaccharide deacetylase family protein [Armatimonadota bacterium]|nr:polysaccharide deacetylase family protein [Armatimonadota bacterium]